MKEKYFLSWIDSCQDKIENNSKLWQSNIGYVPQSIYLLDESIKFNITIKNAP